jgi:glycosyltransferase involved in cell wall biosynthesis
MAGGVIKILILAGRLDADDARWPLTSLLDRLERRGIQLQVLCLSRRRAPTADSRAVEVPALGNRWLRALAVRRLWSEGVLQRPHLMHVVHDEMVDVALALSENDQISYVQTVAGFGSIERGLRLSRRWCRRLVATSQDLAAAMTRGLGIPNDRIVIIPPGIVPTRESFRAMGAWKVPVIGAGGPLEEASGLMIFLDAARLVIDEGYDIEFVIASHGGEQSQLRRRAQQLEIVERVTVGDYPILGAEFWSVLDIYCQPALAASAGHALTRALAHAVPCIATNVRGLRALIESGETGLLIQPNDAGALGKAMVALIDHPEEARRLGQNGLASIEARFDPELEADRLADLYTRELQS